MSPKCSVLRAINMPFDDAEEFDGSDSDAVIACTNIKKQKKVTKFVTIITQSQFLDGNVETSQEHR
jgi:hypothetical protein